MISKRLLKLRDVKSLNIGIKVELSSMAGCLWFAAVFFGFCAIILNRLSDISGYDCRCQPSPAFELVSRQRSSYLPKENIFLVSTWLLGHCLLGLLDFACEQWHYHRLNKRCLTIRWVVN